MRWAIVQYTKQHAECIGLVVEFILKEYKCSQIDVLLFEKDFLGKGWFDFFKLNYSGIVNLVQIYEISIIYDGLFYLTSTDYLLGSSLKHKQYIGLVHQNGKEIPTDGFRNVCISPLINCEIISYKFKFSLGGPKKSIFYPEIPFFVTGWQEHLNLFELNKVLKKHDLKCLYISKRYETHEFFSNLIFCERVDTLYIIDCFLHKICLLVPNEDGAYFNERISGSIHLCASFGTQLLLPDKLKNIYPGNSNFLSYECIED